MKAESIDTHNEDRDKHLRGQDFFAVKQYPDITFKSHSIRKHGDHYEATGELTLHGVSKKVTLDLTNIASAKGRKGEDLIGGEAKLTIKRTEYGMDKLVGPVGDEVNVMIGIEARKN